MAGCYKLLIELRIYKILAIVLILGVSSPVFGQDAPEFDVDVVSLQSDNATGMSRLDVYTRVPMDQLRFLNTSEGFTANYQVSLDVIQLDEDGKRSNLVQSPIWDRQVRVANYADTEADDRHDFTTHTLSLEPGKYVIEFQVEDRSSSESYVNELFVDVKDFSHDVALSDILLLEDFNSESNTIYPNVAPRIGSDDTPLRLFYELYGSTGEEVKVTRDILMLSEASDDEMQNASLSIVYSDEEVTTLSSSRNQHIVSLPTPELAVGRYTALVKVESADGELLDLSQKTFSVEWNGLLAHIDNLEEAVQQLAYIAKKRDIAHIMEPPNESGRLGRFKSYWEKRDPTPGTVRNERMEEYYYRVSFANQKYSSLTDGWKTDRGQVVVLFGEPDMIETHPYNFSVKPYEIWYYYGIGRRFIFVDQSGLGDYRLLQPVWDETTWLR